MKLLLILLITFALTMAQDLTAKGLEFQNLRKLPREDPAVQTFSGEKHKIMEELQSALLGKRVEEIITVMGRPDHIQSEDPSKGFINESPSFMPGPVIPGEGYARPQPIYLIYYWRGLHDYLFFHMINEIAYTSDWYFALD
jgi:hypothetical protein